VGAAFGRDIRKKLFDKVIRMSKSQEDAFSTASLITRTTNDVTQLQNLIIMALRMMINVPFMFAGGLIMAMSKDPKMTLVLLVSIPMVAVIIGFAARKVVPLFKSIQKKIDHLTAVSRENITGIRVIRAFGGEEYEDKRFDQANKSVTQTGLKAARIMSALMPLIMLIMSLTALSVMFIAVFNINSDLNKQMLDYTGIGNMMAVIQYIMQIMFSVVMFSVIFIMVPRASVSATRINEILETEPDIIDPPNPVFPLRQGLVEFENVSFAYSDSAAEKTLENIRFTAKKGTVTAIIGGTGSGKSTLINLIPRQYDATDGKVKIDGVDVREMSLKDLRSRIGFVAQKAVLFEGNIKDNVLYGADKDNRLKQALEIAQAMNIVEEKEGGYEAVVEQGGRNLSGGQKQRLTIARALATDADILVFDDSFSALDFKTDAMLRKALRENTKDKTVIIVAQRIGTVMDADNIIVLDKGKIVGMGRHEELMERCQEYKDIALSQLSEEELAKGGQANG
jgi:ATP-binding cassette subfamily B protein